MFCTFITHRSDEFARPENDGPSGDVLFCKQCKSAEKFCHNFEEIKLFLVECFYRRILYAAVESSVCYVKVMPEETAVPGLLKRY